MKTNRSELSEEILQEGSWKKLFQGSK